MHAHLSGSRINVLSALLLVVTFHPFLRNVVYRSPVSPPSMAWSATHATVSSAPSTSLASRKKARRTKKPRPPPVSFFCKSVLTVPVFLQSRRAAGARKGAAFCPTRDGQGATLRPPLAWRSYFPDPAPAHPSHRTPRITPWRSTSQPWATSPSAACLPKMRSPRSARSSTPPQAPKSARSWRTLSLPARTTLTPRHTRPPRK